MCHRVPIKPDKEHVSLDLSHCVSAREHLSTSSAASRVLNQRKHKVLGIRCLIGLQAPCIFRTLPRSPPATDFQTQTTWKQYYSSYTHESNGNARYHRYRKALDAILGSTLFDSVSNPNVLSSREGVAYCGRGLAQYTRIRNEQRPEKSLAPSCRAEH